MWVMGEDDDEEWASCDGELEAGHPPSAPVSVSLSSVIGIDNPKTMKLLGKNSRRGSGRYD